jgi:glutamate synthase (NADPH/NADH) small chain
MGKISSDSLAIDRKARARMPSLDISHRPVSQRVCDFDDICIPMTPEEAMFEASRCVHCPDPAPCVEACPVHNDIPSAMWLIEQPNFIARQAACQRYAVGFARRSSFARVLARTSNHMLL